MRQTCRTENRQIFNALCACAEARSGNYRQNETRSDAAFLGKIRGGCSANVQRSVAMAAVPL
jgi:hypothetical protein